MPVDVLFIWRVSRGGLVFLYRELDGKLGEILKSFRLPQIRLTREENFFINDNIIDNVNNNNSN